MITKIPSPAAALASGIAASLLQFRFRAGESTIWPRVIACRGSIAHV